MTTLIIHPHDVSTHFLKDIYKDIEHTLVNDPEFSKSKLKELVKTHDRVLIMGHGTEGGLINPSSTSLSYIIDSTWVYLLRENPNNAYIWCNADQFVSKYALKGFYTGMIVSEWDEAWQFIDASCSFSFREIEDSNKLFASTIKEAINLSPKLMCEQVRKNYTGELNPIIDYNKQRIYHL